MLKIDVKFSFDITKFGAERFYLAWLCILNNKFIKQKLDAFQIKIFKEKR